MKTRLGLREIKKSSKQRPGTAVECEFPKSWWTDEFGVEVLLFGGQAWKDRWVAQMRVTGESVLTC